MNRTLKKDAVRVIAVIIAGTLMALNIKTFVRTGNLFPGGATGLTVLIQRLALKFLNVELPYTPINLALNAFPVYIGFRFVGKKFTLLSLLMIIVSSFLADLLPAYVITYDTLLIAIFGGIVNGIAISLCLYVDATSGGTDFIAIYLSQKRGVETWNLVLGFNVIILST
ncbi:MAG: YitT family protein, partial [Lachnospiraceae bacterium]|nr:YitT family protein [Lachnospiraceae bacterium]